jgi:RNA-binding protein with serine-rich domain 1
MRTNLLLRNSLGRGRDYSSKAPVLYFIMNRDKIVTLIPVFLLVLSFIMSERGRSRSPKPLHDVDVDMEHGDDKKDAKAVVVNGLSRNVAHTHLQTIFGFYGEIVKIDLPLYTKSGQNRGKAALEYGDPLSAQKAVSHMNGGQLDGLILKVELSDVPIRPRSRSRPRPVRNGRDRKSFTPSRSRSRTRSPLPPRRRGYEPPRYVDSFRRARGFGRRGPPPRDTYRPSRSRSRSPVRRGDRLPPRRRSPSYERGGTGYARARRSRSRSYSVRSSRSRSQTPSRSRSRTRSRSPSSSSYSRYSRSKTRSRSLSRGRRSYSRDDIRDSRSRSPA